MGPSALAGISKFIISQSSLHLATPSFDLLVCGASAVGSQLVWFSWLTRYCFTLALFWIALSQVASATLFFFLLFFLFFCSCVSLCLKNWILYCSSLLLCYCAVSIALSSVIPCFSCSLLAALVSKMLLFPSLLHPYMLPVVASRMLRIWISCINETRLGKVHPLQEFA